MELNWAGKAHRLRTDPVNALAVPGPNQAMEWLDSQRCNKDHLIDTYLMQYEIEELPLL